MTTREKVYSAGAIAAIALATFFGIQWLHQHDARIVAEAQAKASQQTIGVAQKQIEALKADTAQQARDLQQRISDLEAQKKQQVTPAQFAAMLNALLPKQSAPVVVGEAPAPQTDATAKPGQKAKKLPGAPVVQIPQTDLQALRDYGLTCKESEAKSAACTQQLANANQELNQTGVQLAAKAQEAEQWKNAAKGGSWIHRALTAAKWLGFGAAVGYVAGRKW